MNYASPREGATSRRPWPAMKLGKFSVRSPVPEVGIPHLSHPASGTGNEVVDEAYRAFAT